MANVRSGCASHQELCIRVNGVDSGLMGSDLEVVFGGGARQLGEEPSRIPDSIMLPKCDSIEHLREVWSWLGWTWKGRERRKERGEGGRGEEERVLLFYLAVDGSRLSKE